MINGPPTSLKQAGTDLTQATGQLGSAYCRARLQGKKTGSMTLSQLAGSVTSMPMSFAPNDNIPSNAWQGFPQTYGNIQSLVTSTESGDTTYSFYIGASRKNVAEDAAGECWLNGVAGQGSYRMTVGCRRDPGTPEGAPYSIAIVCFDGGWMRGNILITYSDTYAGDYVYNEVINVPNGYPYVSFVCYQYVYGFPGKPSGDYGTMYYTTFTDARIGKV